MSNASFIISGYVLGGTAIGGYVWWTLRRGRQLSQRVPQERRRWT